MQAPPNLGLRYTREFRQMFVDLARANDAALVPFLLEGVAGRADLNQPDGLHPTAAGAQIMAENVWRVLEPILASELAARHLPVNGRRSTRFSGRGQSRLEPRSDSRERSTCSQLNTAGDAGRS